MTSAPSEHPDTSIAALGRDALERLEVRDQARAARAATVVLQLPRVRPRSSRRTRHSSVAAGPRSPVGYNLDSPALCIPHGSITKVVGIRREDYVLSRDWS